MFSYFVRTLFETSMKTIFYIAIFLIFIVAMVIGGDYFYDIYNSPATSVKGVTADEDKEQPKKISNVSNNTVHENTVSNNNAVSSTKLLTKSPPHLQQGFDWSLPAYADEAKYSGLITEEDTTIKAVKNKFLMVLWSEANPEQGVFDFSEFERDLKRVAPQQVLVRLEVNSACEAPAWALNQIPQSSKKSLIYWDKAYLDSTRPFIQAFAIRYASYPQVIGVQLGLADGDFNGSCGDYDNKNGWGEYWMSPDAIAEAEAKFGFSPEIFESASKANFDIYINAFGKNKYKLALTNIGNLFTYGQGAERYNQKLNALSKYALEKGIGNRDGAIEQWMSYLDKAYGNVITSMPDGTCRLDFDEQFAKKIQGRYWGTENEFYGRKDYVLARHGPFSNQAYRELISSLRALQMRRNYMSTSNGLRDVDHPDYKTQDFLKYLTRVMGKSMENTPDAFVLMGERYVAAYRMGDHTEQACVKNAGDKIAFRSFGRWITESTQGTPAIKISMPKEENYWDQKYYLPEGIDYEYFARESKEFSFDVNDELAQIRCQNGCEVEVKAIFKDTVKTTLNIQVAEGITQNIETSGDNKIKTATFALKSSFKQLNENTDILLKSQQRAIPLIMLRVNLL